MHYDDEQITMGIPEEFIERLMKAGGSTGHLKCVPEYGSGSYMAYYDREHYKLVAIEMMQEAGVKLLFHSFIGGAVNVDNRVIGIRGGEQVGLQAATGRASSSTRPATATSRRTRAPSTSGATIPDNLGQPMTMIFEMANVDATC